MPEQVVVKEVGEGRPWEHGITYWDVVFERNGSDFACEWGKKDDPPTVGEQVEGEFFKKGKDWRFRKPSKPQSGNAPSSGSEARTGTGGGSNSSGEYMRPKLPQEVAEMRRCHSQEMAIQILTAKGVLADPQATPALILDWITDWADDLDADVQKAGQAATQGHIGSVGSPAGVSSAPAPDSPPADEEKRDIEMAIDSASAENLSAEARSLVADYMISQLNEADRERACNQLTNSQDPQAMGMTIRAMKSRTEKWTGSPLPVGDAKDGRDIPFRRPEYREMFSERERWRS